MADRTVAVRLELDVNPYTGPANKAAQATTSIADAGDKASGRLGKAMGSMARTAGQVTAASLTAGTALLTNAMRTGVAYNDLEQTARGALTTLLGGTEQANAMMERVREFGSTSPFPRQVWIQATQQLIGFGVEAEKVIPALSAIQDAAASSGKGVQAIEPIVDVLSRIQSQGRLGGEALMRLGYYGLDAATIIGEQMGKSGDEIRDMASQPGGIPADQIWDPLIDGLVDNFGGAAENIRNTWFGATDRIAGAWRDLSSEIAQPFVTREGGGLAVGWANDFADLLRDMVEKAPAVVDILVGRMTPAFDAFGAGIDRAGLAIGAFDVRTLNASLDELGQYTPLIAGVGTALVALGVQSIPVLRNIPILGTNPLLAGILALVAASPELRGVAVDFIQALGPILPVAQDLAMQLANVAIEVLGTLAPALGSLAQALAPAIVALTQAFAPALSWLIDLARPASHVVAFLAEAIAKVPTPVLAAVTAFAAMRALGIVGFLTPIIESVGRFAGLASELAQFEQTSLAVGAVGVAANNAQAGISGFVTSLNPVGLLVGGLTLGLSALAGGFAKNAQDAAAAKQQMQDYRGTLDEVTRATTDATREMAISNFSEATRSTGLFGSESIREVAADYGIAAKDIIDAIMGVSGAMEQIESQAFGGDWGEQFGIGMMAGDYQDLIAFIEQQQNLISGAQSDQAWFAEAMGISSGATDGLASSADRATQSLSDLARAQRDLSDGAISAREAQIRYADTLDRIGEALDEGASIARDASGAVDENAEATREADQALLDLVSSSISVTDAMGRAGASFTEVEDAARAQREQFIRTATQMGYTAEEAAGLADAYGLIPRRVATDVVLDGADRALSIINSIREGVRGLNGSIARVTVEAAVRNTTGGALPPGINAAVAGAFMRRASGGPIYGPGSETSDSIWARLSNNEHVWSAAEVKGIGGHDVVEQLRAMARSGEISQYASYSGTPHHAARFATGVAGSGGSSRQPAGPIHASASLAGARVEFGADGLARFVDGRVDMVLYGQSSHSDALRRAVR